MHTTTRRSIKGRDLTVGAVLPGLSRGPHTVTEFRRLPADNATVQATGPARIAICVGFSMTVFDDGLVDILVPA